MPAAKTRLNPEDQVFFKNLGERIASLRKGRGWTQGQLAEVLGCSQPRIVQFEKGWRRIPVSELALIAETFGVSMDALVGIQGQQTDPARRGPAPLLQRQLERLARLPKRDQRLVSDMIAGVLQRAGV